MSAYPSIDKLVPHQPPMLWLDALIHWTPGLVRCRACITDDTPFVKDGQLHTATMLEYMAQAVATCLGYEAFQNGEGVRVGMIIACRKLELLQPNVPVGAELVVEAKRLRGDDTVSRFSGTVQHGDEPIASATLTLYHAAAPPDEA